MQSLTALLPNHYLKAGELFIMDKPAMVNTVLGSCIAVTLFNRRLKLAGICHALLPQCIKRNLNEKIEHLLDNKCSECTEAFRYADCSVFMMAEIFSRFGITSEETEVRLFGGAKMMPNISSRDIKYFVGRQNIETAKMVLDHCNLTLTSSDVGGSMGRKIIFNTKTGEVVQRFIRQTIFHQDKKKKILAPGTKSAFLRR